tara:strand:- start:454 stop:891 length:438 start_codon:yes stop_codon:yes gene_type:complete
MALKTERDGNIIRIEDKSAVRIEPGPRRKREKVTEKLLDDAVTAKHYQVGAKDALGKKITIGETMDYLDWRNRESDPVFYVYRKTDVFADPDAYPQYQPPEGRDPGEKRDDGEFIFPRFRWLPVGEYDSEEEAVAAGEAIAKEAE